MASILRSCSSSPSLRQAAARFASRSRTPPLRLPNRTPSAPRLFFRSTAETSSFCLDSLLPLHSATASALMNSLLSATRRRSWLAQGQDDDTS